MNSTIPLLLLPGLMNDERVWSPIVAALDDRRHIRIAATHRHASVDESAREAIAVMPPGRFAVAGFSLGGYVALEVCRQARERIAGLGLLDTGARADADDAKQARIRMVQALGAGTATFEQIAAGFAGRLLHPSHLNDPDLLALLADMARAVGGDGFARQQQAAMNRADQRGLLEELRVPALVLCGREDQVTPVALSKEMAGLLPDAELVIVERSGHMATLEQPEAVVEAVVRWLDVVDGRLRR